MSPTAPRAARCGGAAETEVRFERIKGANEPLPQRDPSLLI